MPAGRPTDYTPELGDLICEGIARKKPMVRICDEDERLPSPRTVYRWLREHDEFRHNYEQALEDRADYLAEEILDIADDGTNDWMERTNAEGEHIGWQLNGEHVQRSRLRVDSRKWIASKLKPKKYGEKTVLSGDPDNPLRIQEIERVIIDDE